MFPLLTDQSITRMISGRTREHSYRKNQPFKVGQGLTNDGIKVLGNKLAAMTISDLESMLDMKNVDPVEIWKLTKEIKDLAKGLVNIFHHISIRKSGRKI